MEPASVHSKSGNDSLDAGSASGSGGWELFRNIEESDRVHGSLKTGVNVKLVWGGGTLERVVPMPLFPFSPGLAPNYCCSPRRRKHPCLTGPGQLEARSAPRAPGKA